jgi:hypothetical protein
MIHLIVIDYLLRFISRLNMAVRGTRTSLERDHVLLRPLLLQSGLIHFRIMPNMANFTILHKPKESDTPDYRGYRRTVTADHFAYLTMERTDQYQQE